MTERIGRGASTLSALNAADTVVYAATVGSDGVDSVTGARRTVQQFRHSRERINAPVSFQEDGIVIGGVRETIMSTPAVASIDEPRETGMLLVPLVPERAIVQEVRLTGEWYGHHRKGAPVLDAYKAIVKQVIR